MAIRATISIELLQASVSAARTTTSVTYELSHATGIWTDPDSKNRMLKDEFPLSDVRFSLVEKNLSETLTFTDVIGVAMLWVRGFTDTFKVYDENPNALNVNLLNSQAMNAQDTSFLVDRGLDKGDALGFSEITAFVHSKGLTDSAIVVDSSSVSLNKSKTDSFGVSDDSYVSSGVNPSDSISFSDSYSRTLSKALTDPTVVDDVRFNLIEKNLSETVTLDEVVGWSYAKNAPETLALVESFAKVVTFNRAFTDAFTLDDLSQIDKDFYGNKGNVAFMLDIIGLDQNKVLTDSYTVGDVIEVAMLWVRGFTDGATLSDSDYFDFGKNKEEIINIGELSAKQLIKPETEILTATDNNVIQAELNKTETLNLSEAYAKTLAKFITDAFTLDDAALVDKDFYGNKGNIVGLTEVLAQGIEKNLTETTSLSDVRGTSLNKPFTETLSFDDITITNIIKTVTDAFTLDDSALVDKDYFGSKGNIVGLTEIVQQGISKIESDIVTISELAEIGYTKPKTETISASDVNALHSNLSKTESISFSDAYIRNIMKGINDGFALDDSAQVNKDVDSTKGNIFSFSDVFSRTVSYDRDYTDSFGFSDTFSIAVGYVRAYSDSYSLNDTRDLHLTKAFVDTFKVYDENPNALNVNLLNSQAMNAQENPVLITTGIGSSDGVGFTEVAAVTQSKALTDSTVVDDTNAILVSKHKTDSFGMSDNSYVSSGVNPSDSISFGDSYERVLSKVLSDAFALDDAALINKNYLGNKGNLIGLSELVSLVTTYKRTISDSVGVSDNNVVASGVNPSDSISFSDSHDRTLSKALSDAFALDDSALINKDFTGSKGNVFGFSDVLSKTVGFNRAFTDAFSFSDDSVRSLNKGINDSSVLNDLLSFSQTKKISEILTFNDDYGVQLEKTLSDSFTLDDSALVNKDYFGNKGNIMSLSDLVAVNLIRSNQLGTRNFNTMPLN